MPPARPAAAENWLLATLPRTDRQRVLDRCEPVDISLGDVLCEPAKRLRNVYFPTNSFISLVVPIAGHAGLEVGMVGREGMLGINLMLGINNAPLHGLVQGAGPAWRMSAAPFRRAIAESPALHRKLNRYLYVQMRELAQTSVCTRFHLVEARLARWLLMTRDRAHSAEFRITHEFMGLMLGVRRVGVTNAAGALQRRGLISYRRGDITILNRRGLEAASCACYLINKRLYESIMA